MTESAWQKDYWNGDAAERWVKHQHQIDRALSAFGRATLDYAQLRAGERVLDVGCGCGATSMAAAARVGPTGAVVGIDLSSPMIEHARAQVGVNHQLSYVCDDASTHSFADTFDVMISRNGLMFFDKPLSAMRHLRSALGREGRTCFVAWRALEDNEWLDLPLRAVQAVLPAGDSAAGTNAPSPFAFADGDYVTQLLAEAGFSCIDVQAFNAPVRFSESGLREAVEFVRLHAGPVGRLLSGADDTTRAQAEQLLAERLTPFMRGNLVELSGAAWIVKARA